MERAGAFSLANKSDISHKADTLLMELNGKLDNYAVHGITKYLRCDNAGENLSDLQRVCNQYKVRMEYTAPNTPQQNGVVERKFVTIRDRSCAMTFSAGWNSATQAKLWAESISTSEYLTNVVSNSRNIKSPEELFTGKQPSIYKHLIEYGRMGWVTNRKKIKKKLAPKAIPCYMIGYAKGHSGDTYRMYNPITKKVIMSRDIKWADWTTKLYSGRYYSPTFRRY